MIGRGGMGAVFRAVDERLERIVALKVLSPSMSRDQASIQRFVNEARAAARLDHDNIARVFYVGEDQGLHFIAHEFVTGRNIRDIIRAEGPLSPRQAVNYTLQIATALRHTAAAGVVHRDIKPSNLIVTPRGRVKLVDLGLAKKVASESFGDLTIAGTTLGTFDYISPEQAKDPRNVDVRSDIYSLGCTLYHMLAGEPPYPEGTVLQKLLDHQAKDIPDPARKNPHLPPELSAVVRRMMAPDPRDRYATPDDLILDLLPIAAEMGLRGINPEGLVWTSQPMGTRSFIERNVTWIVAAAALLVVAVLFDRFSERGARSRVVENGNLPSTNNPLPVPAGDGKQVSTSVAAREHATNDMGRLQVAGPAGKQVARESGRRHDDGSPLRPIRPNGSRTPGSVPTIQSFVHARRPAPLNVAHPAAGGSEAAASGAGQRHRGGQARNRPPRRCPKSRSPTAARRRRTRRSRRPSPTPRTAARIELKYNGRRAVPRKAVSRLGPPAHDPRQQRLPSGHLVPAPRAARHRF